MTAVDALCNSETPSVDTIRAGLMKDHGQQARASENFAGPVDFETPPRFVSTFLKPGLLKV